MLSNNSNGPISYITYIETLYTYCGCGIWLGFTLGGGLGTALGWGLGIAGGGRLLGSLRFPFGPGIDWWRWGRHKLDWVFPVHRGEGTLGLFLALFSTGEHILRVIGFFTILSRSAMWGALIRNHFSKIFL